MSSGGGEVFLLFLLLLHLLRLAATNCCKALRVEALSFSKSTSTSPDSAVSKHVSLLLMRFSISISFLLGSLSMSAFSCVFSWLLSGTETTSLHFAGTPGLWGLTPCLQTQKNKTTEKKTILVYLGLILAAGSKNQTPFL